MKSVLKLLIGVIFFALIFFSVDLNELIAVFRDLTLAKVFYLFLVSFILILVSSYKWQVLIKGLGSSVKLLKLFGLYLVGYAVNLLLPSFVGGDAVRSWELGKIAGQSEALVATSFERFSGLLAMLLLALLFSFWAPSVPVKIKYSIILISLLTFIFTFLVSNTTCYELLLRFSPLKFRGFLLKVSDSIQKVKSNPKLLMSAMLLSFIFHSLTVVNVLVCAYVVGWHNPPLWEVFVVLPIILIISSLPISPNGLGIQEGAFTYFLSSIGATNEQAFGIALILRIKSYVLAIIGAVIWLKVYRKLEKSSQEN